MHRSAAATNSFTSCVAITGLQPGGQAVLKLAGAPSQTYSIQAATNLISPTWENLGSKVVDGNSLSPFYDHAATNYPARFYRSSTP